MQYIKPSWPVPNHVKAYSTTRQNGKSVSPYSSFNLAEHVGDDLRSVQTNRAMLQRELQLPSQPHWLSQIHSNHVAHVTQKLSENLTADASFTQLLNIVCVIMTADCLPILLCDQKGTKIAAIHAGWRGLAAGVIENTLTGMKAKNDEILAWLGPAIGPDAFEVGEDVFTAFTNNDKNCLAAFKPIASGKWLANIYSLARERLKQNGVNQIYGGNYCTYTQDKLFYSYRRDQGVTGRMATLIWLSG